MTWNQGVDKKKILDLVLPNYPSIATCPEYSALEDLADKTGRSLESVLQEERQKIYKAVDNDGNVYTMRNPYACEYFYRGGGDRKERVYIRERSRLVMTYAQAQAESKKGVGGSGQKLLEEF